MAELTPASQLNTHVNAGKQLLINSGGDTTIKGAVASAKQVIADVKGNLNLESLQDLARFDSKSQSISVSGTYGVGVSVSGSYSQSNMHNDYASVQEQSGIKAGDGGFQIKVGGNTDLKGAVISSTQAGTVNNSLTTATLTQSDIENHAISKGSSVGVSGGFSVAGKQTEENKNLMNVGGKKDSQTASLPVIVALSDNSSSTTHSGISGGAVVITDDAAQRAATGKGAEDSIAGLNRDVTTGVDSSGKIGNNFDKSKMQATMEVTAAFAAAAAKEIGDYAKGKLDEADKLAKAAVDEKDPIKKAELESQAKDLRDNWKDDGLAKIALHAAVGALAGGADGALGAGAAAYSTSTIAEQFKGLDIPQPLRDALTLAAGAAVGAVVGGETGAASAMNEVANNFLKHKDRAKLQAAKLNCYTKGNSKDCDTATALEIQDAKSNQMLDALVRQCTGSDCQKVYDFIQQQQRDLGCVAPNICEDNAILSKYAFAALQKAEGIEPIYPESYLLDAKAAYDLAKLGLAVVKGGVINGGRVTFSELQDVVNGKSTGILKIDGAGGEINIPNLIPYEPKGSFISQGTSPVCGPACSAMVINDGTGSSIGLADAVNKFVNGIRLSGVNVIEMEKVISDAGLKNSVNLSMFPSELNRTLEAGGTVIVNVNSHFIIVDGVEVVNGVKYYMTRDPYMGPRGVLARMLDGAMSKGVNAISIGVK